tara:strand:- start:2333 stop:3061 length:729 start_codon:yes stop_codon:yes gene_type:complete
MNFKQQPVVICKDDQKNTIRVSKNNPEYAHIRLTQERSWLSANGWFTKREISTLIHGKTDELKASGVGRKSKLPGNIYIKEQLTPFSKDDPKRDLKFAGKTGVTCKAADPDTGEIVDIYRKTFYDATGTKEDTLIEHINGDEIRKANNADSASINKMIEKAVADREESQEEVNPNQRDLFEAIEEAKAEEIEKAEEDALDPDEDEANDVTVEDSTDEVEVEVEEEIEVLEEEEEVENNPFSL